MDGLSENGPSRKVRGHDGIGVLRVGHRCGELIQHSNGALCRQSEHWEHAAGLGGETGDLTGSKVGAVGAPDQGTGPTTAPRPAPVIGIRGVTRKRAAGIAFPAARGARAASSDEACAYAQTPAPTEHSSKRKRASASDLCQAQNRNRAAADSRSRFRRRACLSMEPGGVIALAMFDQLFA